MKTTTGRFGFKKFLAVVPLLFLAAACGENDLDGNVSDKSVDPGYTYVSYVPMYSTTCSGNPSVCTTTQTGSIPIIYSVPTCYNIEVKGTTSGSACIDQDQWNKISVGDAYQGPDVKAKDLQKETKKK